MQKFVASTYVKKLNIFCEIFYTISFFAKIFVNAKMSSYFREILQKREQLENFLEIFFSRKTENVLTTFSRKRHFACSRKHFRFISPDYGCVSDAIRESNPTLAGTTHNKDTDFLTKVRENIFVSALILAVFQMLYAKAIPRWPARRTIRTQISL
jgi:hypothetical protein